MNRSFLVASMIGLTVLALGVVAIGGVTAQDTVTIDVTVVDQDRNGVGDAELTATWGDDETDTATTTGSGAALLEVDQGERVEIEVDHPIYVRNKPYVLNEDETVPDAGESRVSTTIDVSQSGSVDVTLADEEGQPIEDARVRFYQRFDNEPVERSFNERVATVETDANGIATTRDLERGEYRVTTTQANRFLDTEQRFTIDGPNTPLEITLERGFIDLTVNVTDDRFDPARALEEAQITIDGDTISTRSDGTRTTDIAVNEFYEISITKEDYETYTDEIWIREQPRTLNVSIQRTPEVTVTSSQQRIVVGESTTVTVTDAYSDPVESATISLDGDELGETDADGTFTLQISAEGEQTISVSHGDLTDSITVEGVDPDAVDDEETPADTPEDADADDDDSLGPGLGVGVAVIAVLAIALLARRR